MNGEKEKPVCEFCGAASVEQTSEGSYCTACKKLKKHEDRAVHHEGFPHVVSEEPEP